jgi:hypothetical protein
MESNQIMQTIINTEATLNEKLEKSQLKLFSSSAAISSEVGYHCSKFEFDKLEHFKSDLLIHIHTFEAVLHIRIHVFLGLLDPDPLVRGPDLDPSIINSKKNLDSYCFVTSF